MLLALVWRSQAGHKWCFVVLPERGIQPSFHTWEIAQLKLSLCPRCFVVVHLLKGLFEVDLSFSPSFCIFMSTLGSGAFSFQPQVSTIQLCICRRVMTLCMRTSPGGAGLTQPELLQWPLRSFSLELASPEGLGSETSDYGRPVSQPKAEQAARMCLVR